MSGLLLDGAADLALRAVGVDAHKQARLGGGVRGRAVLLQHALGLFDAQLLLVVGDSGGGGRSGGSGGDRIQLG